MKNFASLPFHFSKTFCCFSLLVLTGLLSVNTYAQDQPETLNYSYQNYFNAERETVYLHFNKHTFLVNEAIWFKGYIYDKKGEIPYLTTSNVYVTLYDKDGNAIKTNLYYAENGTFHGQFEVDKSLASDYYFFKAHTNWMKNFVEDESYTSTAIEIINPKTEDNDQILASTSNYDLQFLPEGGHCIADVNNSIGFKIVNCQGEGIKVEGDIINSKSEVVKSFKSNQLGIGKFDLKMKLGDTYTARYTLNNQELQSKLPIPQPKGFSIAVNNYTTKDLTYIVIKTNKKTLIEESDKTYYVVIHQNQKNTIVNLEINKLDTKHIIPVDSKSLPVGVNTITLFNDQLQPLQERLFFNYSKSDVLTANIDIKGITKDSIPIKIDLKDNNKYAFSSNISVSVLPFETESLNKNRNIISAMLIDPYITGTLEHTNFYFDDMNRIKSFHLDLALMTQGWSKYKWNNIQKGSQNLIIPFDKGVTIEGTLNEVLDPESKYEIQMFSMINNINETRTLNRNKNFSFENYFIKDETQVHFNVLKDGKKITQPKLYARVINKDRSSLNQLFEVPILCENSLKPLTDLNQYSNIDFEGQVLDTVNIYAKQKIVEKKRPNSLKYIGDAFSKRVEITKDQERQYFFITDIINANGFIANNQAGRISIFNRMPVSFTGSNSPLLIIDGVNLGRNYDFLAGMQTFEVEEIFFNKAGLGYGAQGGAGVIRINLKKNLGTLSNNPIARYANSLLINGGFAEQKEFYSPLFFNKSNTLFNSYSAIDWKPELISDKTGTVNFKIKNTGYEKLLFVIEGFSVNGKLVSEIKAVSLKNMIDN